MIVKVEDIIKHEEYVQELPDGADIEALLQIMNYTDDEAYHMVNGKHVPRDFKLKNGDLVTIILALGGG